MYTQCNHCNAIFRVTMKELTAAQGLLRCGECDNIFDAMKSLSQTLPEERRFAKLGTAVSVDLSDVMSNTSSQPIRRPTIRLPHLTLQHPLGYYLLRIGVVVLALLLLLQALYSSRHWLARQPVTTTLTRQICELLGCTITPPRDIRKINLLSRNIYSHPNTPKVLTISAAIQNDAAFPQPYPLIEISFLDQNNAVLALRRFSPEEYIQDFNGELMQIGVPDELLLNITDPGETAVRFQFRFM
ncbi:MJ0042 family finger-like domain-containing protein [Thiothrix caldifontis]|uniref:MJ0042 family finger-like domain-containing protein n=1 Tax=Thiothrix caldifontis TaxID=525918 RepID=A0A1H3Y679_9GAMM|nr:zinc-ribbon and DUF3426 domain-containing protein [Thiothrix caldifontis]SEA06332.1 MJ0042 family finger-like domain-containing protein [Thiothrix caldifontis]